MLNHSIFSRPVVRCIAMGLGLLNLMGCVEYPQITISEPKLFPQHDVVRALAEYRTAIKTGAASISPSSLQETFGVQQLSRTDIQTSASPAGEGLVSAPNPVTSTDISFRDPQGVLSGIGLPARSLLRNLAVNQQLLMGYDLLYKGDSRFQDPAYQVILVRFDISINNYVRRWFSRDFAVVVFGIKAFCGQPEIECGNRVHVYALFPEYAAITSQDSLLQSRIETLASQVGSTTQGVDVKTAGRYQTGLQEQLIGIVDYPQQFAIYEPLFNNNEKSFAFAFGPRRRIEKRFGLNPLRWFGSTYTIDYEIEPGPRDLYAILIVPSNTNWLELNARPIPYFLSQDSLDQIGFNAVDNMPEDSQSLKTAQEVSKPQEDSQSFKMAQQISKPLKPTLRKQLEPRWLAWALPVSTPPPTTQASRNNFTCETTDKIIPTVTSTLLVSCSHPLSTDTDVIIGPLSVTKDQIILLDRYNLKVTVPATQALETVAKGLVNELDVKVISSGRIAEARPYPSNPQPSRAHSLRVKIEIPTAPDIAFLVEPSRQGVGQPIQLILINEEAQYITEVAIGNETISVPSTNIRTNGRIATITVPRPQGGQLPTNSQQVRVTIRKGNAPPQILLRQNAFTYN